jgi:hypothetical protein
MNGKRGIFHVDELFAREYRAPGKSQADQAFRELYETKFEPTPLPDPETLIRAAIGRVCPDRGEVRVRSALVAEAFGIDRGQAAQLCASFGYDPNARIRGR